MMRAALAAILLALGASVSLASAMAGAPPSAHINLAVDADGETTITTPSADGSTFVVMKGRSEQGGLLVGTVKPGAKVALNGQPVMVDAEGRFVIGFDRDAPNLATLSVDVPSAEKATHTAFPIPVAPRTWDIQRINGLPPHQVTPTPEELIRIKKETARKAAARRRDTQGSWFAEEFAWPAQGPVSGIFGSQRILNGEPRAPHYGVDVSAPEGTPVKAPAGGIVRLAETDFYFEGGLVFIDHGHGLISYMMHMSRVDAHVGEEVRQGDVIGAVGRTGRATGPHLHWGMFWLDAHIDPQLLVPPMPSAPPKE
jgi:hypothetical protein